MYPKHHDKIIKLGLEEVPYLPNLTLNGCHLILTYLPKEKKKKDIKTLDRKVHLWFPTLPITRRCMCPSRFPRNVEPCVLCAVRCTFVLPEEAERSRNDMVVFAVSTCGAYPLIDGICPRYVKSFDVARLTLVDTEPRGERKGGNLL